MSFQTAVNAVPAPGIAGDFASTNPRRNTVSGPGGFVAGAAGVTCGNFAWLGLGSYTVLNNSGAGKPNGFCHNAHNALITTYLGEVSLVVPAGFPFGELFDAGDFWIANNTGNAVIPGLKVYANNTTGAASSFAATGTPSTAGTSTASTIAAGTSSFTGVIAIPTAGNTVGPGTAPALLTASAVTGTIYNGTVLSGTGVATGTQIVSQVSGTTGGAGVYIVSIAQAVASTTISGTYGLLTIGGTVVSGFAVGQALSAGSAGTVITALGTGSGGAGTYIVNNTQTVGSGAINSYIGTETDWFTASFGNGTAGEVVKIVSKWP